MADKKSKKEILTALAEEASMRHHLEDRLAALERCMEGFMDELLTEDQRINLMQRAAEMMEDEKSKIERPN